MSMADGLQYYGEWRDGQPEGFGVFRWGGSESNGQIYSGQVLDGKWHGSGVLNFASDEKKLRQYAGNFEKSLRHGHGVCIYVNGDVFHGQFLGDKVSGFGTLHCAHAKSNQVDPLILVEGEFLDGLLHGLAKLTYCSGRVEIDYWHEGNKERGRQNRKPGAEDPEVQQMLTCVYAAAQMAQGCRRGGEANAARAEQCF
jgi:hypothetical protein